MSLRKRVAALEQERLNQLLAKQLTPAFDPDEFPLRVRVLGVREVGDLGEIKYAAAISLNNVICWQDSRLVDDEDAAKRIAHARAHRAVSNMFGGTK